MIDLASLRCACGSTEIVCVDPGSAPVISEASDIMVGRGQPPRATCLACWLPLRGYQQSLFAETA